MQLSKQDVQLLRFLRPCGVILYSRNFDDGKNWFKWYERLVNDICKNLETRSVILSVDHEGGRVIRFPSPFTRFPYPQDYGDFAYEVAAQMAEELKCAGINLTYSPCVDIDSNPHNPVIGKRAFSSDPSDVVTKAKNFLKGLADVGICGCLKHYPGHGDTSQDSHHSLPVVRKTILELESCELIPYKELAKDAKFVMTAHVLFPSIDDRPATLSMIFMEYLKDELKFPGFIICDDIEMKALDSFPPDDLIKNLSEVGVDLILYSRNEKLFDEYFLKLSIDKQVQNIALNQVEFLEEFTVNCFELRAEIFEKGKILLDTILQSR